MTGSMRTFVTEGEERRERRDGSNFKGPKCWSNKVTVEQEALNTALK